MSANNKVVWSEGLFLQPQHFQQQERYFERFVEGRCQPLVPYSWGFTEIEIERDLLGLGKFGLRRATGIFPDGTPFRMPDEDPLPLPIDIGSHVRDQVVSLAVPLRRGDAPAVDTGPGSEGLLRHVVRSWEARNVASATGEAAPLEVGAVSTRFLLSSDLSQAYACIPLVHVVECRSDKQVVLEEKFIPTVLTSRAAKPLADFIGDLVALLHQRGERLSGEVVATSRGGEAEIGDYLTLQVINRYEPLVTHLAETGLVHPEELFRLCVAAAGELATFTTPTKRRPALAPYRHERLRESFTPVMNELRRSLNYLGVRRAVSIPIEPKRFNMHVAVVNEKELFDSAVFVLAAQADLAGEDIRRRLPTQFRVGTVERIASMVRLQLPGIPLHPMPTPPPQVPFYAGQVYFELDQTHELWAQLRTSGGLALHVAGDFPGLALKLWAIRR